MRLQSCILCALLICLTGCTFTYRQEGVADRLLTTIDCSKGAPLGRIDITAIDGKDIDGTFIGHTADKVEIVGGYHTISLYVPDYSVMIPAGKGGWVDSTEYKKVRITNTFAPGERYYCITDTQKAGFWSRATYRYGISRDPLGNFDQKVAELRGQIAANKNSGR